MGTLSIKLATSLASCQSQ